LLNEKSDVKDCIMRFSLLDPHELKTRVGAQLVGYNLNFSTATIKVGGSYIGRNVSGRADSILAEADYNRYQRSASIAYQIPWLGPWRIKTMAKGYITSYGQPLFPGSKANLYLLSQHGGLCTFRYEYGRAESACTLGIESMKLKDISVNHARAIQFEPHIIDQPIFYAYFEPTIFYNNLDDSLNPHAGCYGLLTAKCMIPFNLNDAMFLKIYGECSAFQPFAGAVVGGRLKIGHIFYEQFKRIMPSERFYLGGPFSIRGYYPDLAPPVSFIEHDGCLCPVPVGGKTLILGNIEMRIPLANWLTGALFTDAGSLATVPSAKILKESFVAASGGGVRFVSPVGLIRFDIGFKWKRAKKLGSRFAWFVTIGNAF
jgi:outer membrane protein assembly factor BamA